jgi:hypothetical protein
VKHADSVEVLDENGQAIPHTQELIHQLFDQELERLLREGAKSGSGEGAEEQATRLREARRLSEEMINRGEFNPV